MSQIKHREILYGVYKEFSKPFDSNMIFDLETLFKVTLPKCTVEKSYTAIGKEYMVLTMILHCYCTYMKTFGKI